jgi:hypothetical protein
MYKAALVLGSGSAIGTGRRRAAAPAGRELPVAARAAAALGLPLAALAAAVTLAGGIDAVGGPATAVLLAFAWAGGAHAVDGWLRSGPPRALLAAAAGTAVAAAAYVGLLAGAKAFLAPSLPAMGGVDPWLAVALVPAVVAATAARILAPAAGSAAQGAAAATAYAWLLDAGAVDSAAQLPRRRRAPRRWPAVRVGRPAEVLS